MLPCAALLLGQLTKEHPLLFCSPLKLALFSDVAPRASHRPFGLDRLAAAVHASDRRELSMQIQDRSQHVVRRCATDMGHKSRRTELRVGQGRQLSVKASGQPTLARPVRKTQQLTPRQLGCRPRRRASDAPADNGWRMRERVREGLGFGVRYQSGHESAVNLSSVVSAQAGSSTSQAQSPDSSSSQIERRTTEVSCERRRTPRDTVGQVSKERRARRMPWQ